MPVARAEFVHVAVLPPHRSLQRVVQLRQIRPARATAGSRLGLLPGPIPEAHTRWRRIREPRDPSTLEICRPSGSSPAQVSSGGQLQEPLRLGIASNSCRHSWFLPSIGPRPLQQPTDGTRNLRHAEFFFLSARNFPHFHAEPKHRNVLQPNDLRRKIPETFRPHLRGDLREPPPESNPRATATPPSAQRPTLIRSLLFHKSDKLSHFSGLAGFPPGSKVARREGSGRLPGNAQVAEAGILRA